MRQGRVAMRLAPLLAVGALGLHELNSVAAGHAPTGHGHSYLPLAAAVVTVLLALACGHLAREVWRASRGRLDPPRAQSLTLLWPLAAGALLSTFALQEWIEGWTTPGHPAGLSHLIAHIGWLAPTLAIALGALIALLVRGSQHVIARIAKRHAAPRPERAPRGTWSPLPPARAPRLAVLASNRAGRAPPVSSIA